MAKKLRGAARDIDRERRWRRFLAVQARSGLSVRAYCREKGLPEASFYYWRREILRREQEEQSSETGGPSEGLHAKVGRKPTVASFCEVSVKRDGSASTRRGGEIEVVLPSSVILRVGREVEVAHLRRVLEAVEAREC
jgi:hypothetical protein